MLMSLEAALWFLPFVTPICIWVAWSDLKFMKIPNMAVYALVAVFVVVGLIALPFQEYLSRYVNIVVVLAIGFVLNLRRMVGAGDAKFAAAMAAFVPAGGVIDILMVFAGVLLGAFATHRIFRALPALRGAGSDWASWTHARFPMGFALGGTLLLYIILSIALAEV